MDTDLYELVQKILWGVSFIAVGGALVVMFFLVFAQSIVGSRTISTQLEKLLQQNEQISRQLKQLIEHPCSLTPKVAENDTKMAEVKRELSKKEYRIKPRPIVNLGLKISD